MKKLKLFTVLLLSSVSFAQATFAQTSNDTDKVLTSSSKRRSENGGAYFGVDLGMAYATFTNSMKEKMRMAAEISGISFALGLNAGYDWKVTENLKIGLELAYSQSSFWGDAVVTYAAPVINQVTVDTSTILRVSDYVVNVPFTFKLNQKWDLFTSAGLGFSDHSRKADITNFRMGGVDGTPLPPMFVDMAQSQKMFTEKDARDTGLVTKVGFGAIYGITDSVDLKMGAYWAYYTSNPDLNHKFDFVVGIRRTF